MVASHDTQRYAGLTLANTGMPFDIIGDVHGCYDELRDLLARLGCEVVEEPMGHFRVTVPVGRRVVFLGDLVDRGPRIADALRLCMDMVEQGVALCVLGNHEVQMLNRLDDPTAEVAWGLAETLEQLAAEPPELTERARQFAQSLPTQLALDGGRLVIAHAGLPEHLQGQDSPTAERFALYGRTTGTERESWAPDYRGEATVVYGHTPTAEPQWIHRTICIDTGCVYGGRLTALRYPELELVSVAARRAYYAD